MIEEKVLINDNFARAKSALHDYINGLRLTNEERSGMFDLLWDMENAFGELRAMIPNK